MTTFSEFFEVRIGSIPAGRALDFDLYLFVNQKPVLFRKRGEQLTGERMEQLQKHGGQHFLVPEAQRHYYVQSLKNIISDPDSKMEEKAKFIKESAFIHVHDLFTKDNVAAAVQGAAGLVEEMVNFVSSDVAAVASLMKLSVHDYYTYNHCVDVGVYSIVLAKKAISEDRNILLAAGMGGLLHDIGKRRISLDLLNKKAKLTPEEWEEMKRHTDYGFDLVRDINAIPKDSKLIVYEHHENFNGKGYPRGLKEEEISQLARLVAIADVFDALTTNRSYHSAVSADEALKVMFGMQPGKFDPNLFKAFDKNFAVKAPFTLHEDFDACDPRTHKKAS